MKETRDSSGWNEIRKLETHSARGRRDSFTCCQGSPSVSILRNVLLKFYRGKAGLFYDKKYVTYSTQLK